MRLSGGDTTTQRYKVQGEKCSSRYDGFQHGCKINNHLPIPKVKNVTLLIQKRERELWKELFLVLYTKRQFSGSTFTVPAN